MHNAFREFGNLQQHSIVNTIYWLEEYIKNNPDNNIIKSIRDNLVNINAQLNNLHLQFKLIIFYRIFIDIL